MIAITENEKKKLREQFGFRFKPAFDEASRKSFFQAEVLRRDNPDHPETLPQAFARLMLEKADSYRAQAARFRNNPMLQITADLIEESARRVLDSTPPAP